MVIGLQKKVQANRIVPEFQELLILSPIITKNFSYTGRDQHKLLSASDISQMLDCTGLPGGFWLLEFSNQWLSP